MLDVGVGPAFLLTPQEFAPGKEWFPGIALDLHAVVPGALARARAPKEAKGLIAADGEVEVAPWYLSALPREVILAPGDRLSVYGARWELLGLGGGMALGGVELGAHAALPSVAVTSWQGPAMTGTQVVGNFGAALGADAVFKPYKLVNFELGWVQQAGYATRELHGVQASTDPWTLGTLRIQVHVRFPLDIKA
jgi:hypothetical protein